MTIKRLEYDPRKDRQRQSDEEIRLLHELRREAKIHGDIVYAAWLEPKSGLGEFGNFDVPHLICHEESCGEKDLVHKTYLLENGKWVQHSRTYIYHVFTKERKKK